MFRYVIAFIFFHCLHVICINIQLVYEIVQDTFIFKKFELIIGLVLERTTF